MATLRSALAAIATCMLSVGGMSEARALPDGPEAATTRDEAPSGAAPAATRQPARRLVPKRAIARPAGPVEIEVVATEPRGALTVQVIDRAGKLLDTFAVTPGVVDALALSRAVAETHGTVWLQLAEDGRSVGPPLWVTPLRGPPPVRTVRSIRASNQQPYLRVVGWGDRAFDPSDAETAAAMPGWSTPDPVVTAGFRVEYAVDAVIVTSEGRMRVALAPDAAPATVENFMRLAWAGFYDQTIFHRVVPVDREGRPFVVQGGDPTGTGDGGPGWNLALEPSDLPHDRGVLGMARGDDPHSAGSQFYIGLSREGTARLDGQYCTFGFLLDGFDVLDRISRCEIGDAATGRPVNAPRIERIEFVLTPPCSPPADPHRRKPAAPPLPSGETASPAVSPAPTSR